METQKYLHPHACIYAHIDTCIHLYTHTHTRDKHSCTQTRAHTETYMRTLVYTDTHMCTSSCTHALTRTLTPPGRKQPILAAHPCRKFVGTMQMSFWGPRGAHCGVPPRPAARSMKGSQKGD